MFFECSKFRGLAGRLTTDDGTELGSFERGLECTWTVDKTGGFESTHTWSVLFHDLVDGPSLYAVQDVIANS